MEWGTIRFISQFMYRKISEGREKLFQEVNKLMEIKYAAKTVYLFHMTLIVIDSIRIQFILFLYTAKHECRSFYQIHTEFIFLCVLLRPVQGCMENGGLRPSYDRIDEQEPGLGITIGAKSTNHQMTRKNVYWPQYKQKYRRILHNDARSFIGGK